MRLVRQLLTFCAVIGTMAAATPLLAADAAKDLVLKGDAKCTRCHDEADSPELLAIATTRHGVKGDSRTPSCTSCHGESEKHLGHKGSDKPPKPDRTFGKTTANSAQDRSGACLTCHQGEKRTYWEGSQHPANDVACSSCHTIHGQNDKVRNKKTQTEVCFTCHKTERAEGRRISTHPIEAGKVVCSDCHNTHGSAGPKLLKKNTVIETCFTCHAEKRGPFLFEHRPMTESCVNCHSPHGSNISPLLRTRPPFLCQECHDGTHASGSTAGRNAAGNQAGFIGNPSANVVGSACLNCHRQIHGSNSPAGGYFQR